jgi:hypothetical protein
MSTSSYDNKISDKIKWLDADESVHSQESSVSYPIQLHTHNGVGLTPLAEHISHNLINNISRKLPPSLSSSNHHEKSFYQDSMVRVFQNGMVVPVWTWYQSVQISFIGIRRNVSAWKNHSFSKLQLNLQEERKEPPTLSPEEETKKKGAPTQPTFKMFCTSKSTTGWTNDNLFSGSFMGVNFFNTLKHLKYNHTYMIICFLTMNFQDNLKAQLERLKHEIKRSAEMSDKYDEVIDLPLLKIFPTKYIVVLKHREIKQTPNLTKKVTKKHHWLGTDAEFW